MAHTWAELMALSDEQVVDEHDRKAQHTEVGLNAYREELTRRATERATAEIVRLTRRLRDLTRAIAALTVVGVVGAVLSLLP